MPKPLSPDEQQRLLFLVQEARSRGIKLDEEFPQQKKKLVWPVAPNGYFMRNDGKFYNPSPNHEAFIKSTARNSMLFGPRGCGKSGAGSQKALFKIMQGLNGIVMNPDFENLKISTWPEFRNWIPWKMVIASQRHRSNPEWQPHQPFAMVFLNGTTVYGGK